MACAHQDIEGKAKPCHWAKGVNVCMAELLRQMTER